MKKKLLIFISLLLSISGINLTNAAWTIFDCEELGYNAIDNGDGTCSCKQGYHVELNPSRRLVCVRDKNCKDMFGKNSIQNIDGTCGCADGYILHMDPEGNSYCMEGKAECRFQFGEHSIYSPITNSCVCEQGYELSPGVYGAGYQCKSCETKYGINSFFNKELGVCQCKDGYSLQFGKCYKEGSSSYFYLKSYDYNNKVNVISYDNLKAYEIQFQNVGNVYETREYIGEIIEIKLGYDDTIDVGDIFTLDSPTQHSGIQSKIVAVKEISNQFDYGLCQNMYGKNTSYIGNNKCACNYGYVLNTEKTQCIRNSSRSYFEYYDKEAQTPKNPIFDIRNIRK